MSKKRRRPESQQMPTFSLKSTEELNLLISQYGMKKSSSRSFMIQKLEEIWVATNNMMTQPSYKIPGSTAEESLLQEKESSQIDTQVMPDYSKNTTEELNQLISRYGMKKSTSRNFMIQKLEEIWLATQGKTHINAESFGDDKDEDSAAKKKKKRKSKKETFVCEENQPLAKAFLELGGYAFKEDNRNVGSTYMKAAKSIREFPEVIESGKQMKNVKGIGKVLVAMIDEFLEMGVIEKLQEYRAVFG